MTVPNNVSPGDEVTSEFTNQLLAVVRELDAQNDVVSIARSGAQLVVTQRDGTTTRLDIPSGGTSLPAFLQADEEVLHSRAGSLYWDPIREVPIAGTVGHVLTVVGENDDDYAWRAAPSGGGGDTSGLDGRITDNANNIAELERERTTDRQSIADNEGRITTAETDINNLEAEDATLAASIATNTGAITALNLPAAQTDGSFPVYNLGTNPTGDARGPYYWQRALSFEDLAAWVRTVTNPIEASIESTPRLIASTLWDNRVGGARDVTVALWPHTNIPNNFGLVLNVQGIQIRIETSQALPKDEQHFLTFGISQANAGTLTRATAKGYLTMELIVRSDVYHGIIPVIQTIGRRFSTVLAAEDASDTAGVLTITLPVGYETYHDLSFGGWETADDSLFAHDIPTELLASQNAPRNITISGNPGAAGATIARWDPSNRTFTATQQRNAPWRIVYAELHD